MEKKIEEMKLLIENHELVSSVLQKIGDGAMLCDADGDEIYGGYLDLMGLLNNFLCEELECIEKEMKEVML